jgi:3-hydroxyisobutyrate dehydrogenase-like beta-hydroxyacid dehydrogenase
VARCLIIGCGCRGRTLAARLRDAGHVVRGTTRDPGRRAELEAAGVEALVADPDRVATLAPALAHVVVVYVLLGSVTGTPEQVAALHGPRLEMLLSRMLDTTIRGIVYETAGSVDAAVLRGGAEIVRQVCAGSRIPYALLDRDPAEDYAEWVSAAAGAADRVLR